MDERAALQNKTGDSMEKSQGKKKKENKKKRGAEWIEKLLGLDFIYTDKSISGMKSSETI